MMSYSWHPSFPCPGNDTDDLCHLFAWTAWKTWWDLGDSQRLNISISEESITDMLLLEMLRRTKRIVCKKFTRHEERKSGADWQWWFISGNRGFPIRIQAKRLYPCGRYKELKYKKGSRYDQTNTLLRTARNDGFFALVLFLQLLEFKKTSAKSELWLCISISPNGKGASVFIWSEGKLYYFH